MSDEPVLTIEPDGAWLTAKMNGVDIPFIESIRIDSAVGSFTRVIITCVVDPESNRIIIKQYPDER